VTPEHRRVAAFLLRDEEVSPPAEEAGAPLPGAEAVPAQRAWQPAQGVWAWVHNRHNSREFVAFAALVKLSLILLTLTAFAPEFQKSGGNRRPVGGLAASVVSRAVPGVPVRAAEEPLSMQSVKRSVVSACVALPLLFASGAVAQAAVEWKQSAGGNGHWYRMAVISSGDRISWTEARAAARVIGGDLATITSSEEDAILASVVSDLSGWTFTDGTRRWGYGPWIGGYQDRADPNYSEPSGGWHWVSGEPWSWTKWGPIAAGGSEPNNGFCLHEDYLGLFTQPPNVGPTTFWADMGDVAPCTPDLIRSYVIEWDADCNGDGIVDYGQILSGELVDANGNGVPDCCDNSETCLSGLVANGSFEAGSPLAACASESVTSGSLVGSGWQVSAGTVDRTRGGAACASATQPRFGDYCIDLCGTPASSGAIRQIVATIPGHKYRCTFWLSGDASAAPATKKVHAKVGTYIDLSYTLACSGSGAQNWVVNQFEFTARGASEALEFAADNGVTTAGPMIDAISLVDITTQCVGDLDVSGAVDGADIALLLLNFGPCPTTPW